MNRIILLLLLTLLMVLGMGQSLLAAPDTRHFVANEGNDSGTCTDSANPCRTITYALSQIEERGEVRVAAGVYAEAVQIGKAITLTGGYTLSNWLTPEWTVNQTILDGKRSFRPLTVSADSVLVDGFVVRNGDASGSDGSGGGVYIGPGNTVFQATLRNLRIEHNIASTVSRGMGGGLGVEIGTNLLAPSRINLNNITVISNTATSASESGSGGGISIFAAGISPLHVEMSNVTVQGNLAGKDFASNGGGVAMTLNNGIATLRQVRVIGNRVSLSNTMLGGPSRGGGIDLDNGKLVLENVLVAGNQGERGGALAVQSSNTLKSQVTLNYVTLADNRSVTTTVGTANPAIRIDGTRVILALSNTLISGNPLAIEALAAPISPTLLMTTTLVDVNVSLILSGTMKSLGAPLRAVPGFVDAAAGDYHLAEGSAAIDAGNNQLPAFDLDGVGRPKGVRSDIGTYEYAPLTRRNQTINFTPPIDALLQSQQVTLTVSASSGLPVTVAALTPARCTVNGMRVTLLDTGTCTLRASQEGSALFHPATPVVHSFAIKSTQKQDQVISFSKPENLALGDAPAVLNATASSGLPISFRSDSPATCTVESNRVSALALGICTITVVQDGNGSFNPATPVTQHLDVVPAGSVVRRVYLPVVVR